MSQNIKNFIYNRGKDAELDGEFEQAASFEHVKLGDHSIFWRKGFCWYVVAIECVARAFRRIEEIKTKVCCGPANFDIEKLMLVLKDGEVLEIRIGDGAKREAEELFKKLRTLHPELQYSKE